MTHPSAYAPNSRRDRILHTLGLLAVVFVILPVSLAKTIIQMGLTQFQRRLA